MWGHQQVWMDKSNPRRQVSMSQFKRSIYYLNALLNCIMSWQNYHKMTAAGPDMDNCTVCCDSHWQRDHLAAGGQAVSSETRALLPCYQSLTLQGFQLNIV